jgi:hypothetical protein
MAVSAIGYQVVSVGDGAAALEEVRRCQEKQPRLWLIMCASRCGPMPSSRTGAPAVATSVPGLSRGGAQPSRTRRLVMHPCQHDRPCRRGVASCPVRRPEGACRERNGRRGQWSTCTRPAPSAPARMPRPWPSPSTPRSGTCGS